jgi:hypothetical protein
VLRKGAKILSERLRSLLSGQLTTKLREPLPSLL